MNAKNAYEHTSREIIRSQIEKAFAEKFVQWNDGLDFTEFIQALWRLFMRHDDFKKDTEVMLQYMPEEDAMQLLADEIDLTKLKSSQNCKQLP